MLPNQKQEDPSYGGGVVTALIAVAAACSIFLSYDCLKLAEFGGYVILNSKQNEIYEAKSDNS